MVKVIDKGKGSGARSMGGICGAFKSRKGQGGTGLGLALVKKIVEEHKGTVEARSKQGEGTTFVVRIPASTEELDSGGTAGPGEH